MTLPPDIILARLLDMATDCDVSDTGMLTHHKLMGIYCELSSDPEGYRYHNHRAEYWHGRIAVRSAA